MENFAKICVHKTGKSNAVEMIIRAISFTSTFLVVHVNVLHYFLIGTLSLLSGQAATYYIIITFQRFLGAAPHSLENHSGVDLVVRMYREIQLLCSMHNYAHKLAIIPPMVILGMMGTSISMFVLVYLSELGDIKGILIFSNVLVNSIGIILLWFHLALCLYSESRQLLASKAYLKMQQGNLTLRIIQNARRILIKYCKSFPVLKIYFFQSIFF